MKSSSPFTSLLSLFCHTASSSDSIESIVNATRLEGLHKEGLKKFPSVSSLSTVPCREGAFSLMEGKKRIVSHFRLIRV